MSVPRRGALWYRGMVAATWLFVAAGCSRAPDVAEPVRAVRTWRADVSATAPTTALAGEVRARHEALIGFQVAGRLRSRDVQLGDPVRSGQVLARLDPEDLRLAQHAAEAAAVAARTQQVQAEADYRRFEALRAQGFISEAELERRKSALEAASAQYRQAQASSRLQGNQSSHAELRAPQAGIVTAVLADPGTVLSAGAPVVRLAQAGPRDAVFSVPEDQLSQAQALLGVADGLKVRVGADPTERPATLRELAAAADPATRTFLAKADLHSTQVPLNQTATVSMPLPVNGAADAVLVPVTALAERDGHSVVWSLDQASMTVQPRPVTLVQPVGDRWRVRGVKPGTELVTAGLHVLRPGQKVRRLEEGRSSPDVAASAAVR